MTWCRAEVWNRSHRKEKNTRLVCHPCEKKGGETFFRPFRYPDTVLNKQVERGFVFCGVCWKSSLLNYWTCFVFYLPLRSCVLVLLKFRLAPCGQLQRSWRSTSMLLTSMKKITPQSTLITIPRTFPQRWCRGSREVSCPHVLLQGKSWFKHICNQSTMLLILTLHQLCYVF